MCVRVGIITINWSWGRAWGWRISVSWHAHMFGGGIYQSAHQDCISNACGWKPTSLRMHRPWPAQRAIQTPTAAPPQKGQPLPVTRSPQNHVLDAYFNSPQGRISPPLLEWGCPVWCLWDNSRQTKSEGSGERRLLLKHPQARVSEWNSREEECVLVPWSLV